MEAEVAVSRFESGVWPLALVDLRSRRRGLVDVPGVAASGLFAGVAALAVPLSTGLSLAADVGVD